MTDKLNKTRSRIKKRRFEISRRKIFRRGRRHYFNRKILFIFIIGIPLLIALILISNINIHVTFIKDVSDLKYVFFLSFFTFIYYYSFRFLQEFSKTVSFFGTITTILVFLILYSQSKIVAISFFTITWMYFSIYHVRNLYSKRNAAFVFFLIIIIITFYYEFINVFYLIIAVVPLFILMAFIVKGIKEIDEKNALVESLFRKSRSNLSRAEAKLEEADLELKRAESLKKTVVEEEFCINSTIKAILQIDNTDFEYLIINAIRCWNKINRDDMVNVCESWKKKHQSIIKKV